MCAACERSMAFQRSPAENTRELSQVQLQSPDSYQWYGDTSHLARHDPPVSLFLPQRDEIDLMLQ